MGQSASAIGASGSGMGQMGQGGQPGQAAIGGMMGQNVGQPGNLVENTVASY